MKNLYLLPLLLFYCACSPSSSYLDKAGENQSEITKVLDYYTTVHPDSLKLEAAVFLFTHMDGHYALSNDKYKEYLSQLDSLPLNIAELQLGRMIPQLYYYQEIGHMERYNDLEHITSSYLIHHIDHIFNLWENEPWLQDTDFKDICEYLLPYRIVNEPLIDWEKCSAQLRKQTKPLLYDYDDMKYSINNLTKDLLKNTYTITRYNTYRTDMNLPIIGNYRFECQDFALQDLVYYRMFGIPASIDYVIYWGNTEARHYWAAPITHEMKSHSPIFEQPRRAGKVFRKTYSGHSTFPRLEDEYYPLELVDSFSIDVTDEYMKCYDLEIKYQRRPKHQYKYLAVFNDLKWRPISISENSAFLKMGGNLVYQPVCLDVDGEEQPLAYPFILDGQGRMKSLEPDMKHPQSVKLFRKYPYEARKGIYNMFAEGTVFIASNQKDLTDSDTLFSITENIAMDPHQITCTSGNSYRYIKISPKRSVSLSQIKFFDNKEIKISGYELSGQFSQNIPFVFDDDILSYGDIRENLTIDLGEECNLKKIVFQGRHDGNSIEPGDTYELLYMTLDGWKSCGEQTATTTSLIFENTPSNALLLLRDRTKGKEERPFTYQNGAQRFW